MSKKDKMDSFEEEELKLQEDREQTQQETTEDTINDSLASLQDEFEKEKDRYLRLFAEFENYKRRTGRERVELFRTAGEEIIVALLPILDDFDRAIKEIEKNEDDSHFAGINLINKKLSETLRSKGLESMDTKAGDTFDADRQEAITQIPAPEDKLKGKIIDVVEKGYMLGDKIIRYPKVVIGK